MGWGGGGNEGGDSLMSRWGYIWVLWGSGEVEGEGRGEREREGGGVDS